MNIINLSRQLIYPERCLACDEILDVSFNRNEQRAKELYCPSCKSKVRFVGKNTCLKCGKPVKNPEDEFCRDCLKKKHYFAQGRACFVYCGPMRHSMYLFKYSNRRSKARGYVHEILRTNGRWLHDIDVDAIVPVPMYGRKERLRGYNQAKVLAWELSRAMGVPCYDKLVSRRINTQPMKELDEAGRRRNLEKAFILASSVVKLRKILLVDDIYTTGATYDAITEILLEGGVESVYCMSICIGSD